jgi:hypothetical protein
MPIQLPIDFAKQFKGHGWVGISYKLSLMKIITKLLFTSIQRNRCPLATRNTWYSWCKFNLRSLLQIQ